MLFLFGASLFPFVIVLAVGALRLRSGSDGRNLSPSSRPLSFVAVLIPLKGVFPGQREVLLSLVRQNHPNFEILFILESDNDGAKSMVDDICFQFAHCRKIISGRSCACAQKNHSLINGIDSLKPLTEIIVFCDGGSAAGPDWLASLTRPIEMNRFEVVTTFRAFHPDPPTMAGVCMAIYASFLTLAKAFYPKPWGGGTAIRRKTFDALDIVGLWAKTVVDDMVLGNALDRAGIKVKMDAVNQLNSHIKESTLDGFLGYLERQILFPKFTNPGIWLTSLILMVNISLAVLAGVFILIDAVIQTHVSPATWGAAGFFSIMFAGALGFWRVNSVSPPVGRWLISVLPCIFLATWVCIRSIFRNAIVWRGRRYGVGREGVVLNVRCEKGDENVI
ncbi:MAG: glycosyltransferase [Deltaproteobacteria bacterium]|nr:glycosyltransferase [Deltaproteobacteria bacterium]